MADIIRRTLNDKLVAQRPEDGYINATQLCRAAGKQWGAYYRNLETTEFLEELARSMQFRIDVLVQSITTGPNDQRGTWVHPRVAYHLGQWCSPKAAVQVTAWLEELHKTGTVSLIPQQAATPGEVALALAQGLVALERDLQQEIRERKALAARVDVLTDRQAPAGKIRVEDWLRLNHKPYLQKTILANLRATCRDLEEPEMFRPEGCEYPMAYFSPYTIATAYERVTRQLSFFSREASAPYRKKKVREHHA